MDTVTAGQIADAVSAGAEPAFNLPFHLVEEALWHVEQGNPSERYPAYDPIRPPIGAIIAGWRVTGPAWYAGEGTDWMGVSNLVTPEGIAYNVVRASWGVSGTMALRAQRGYTVYANSWLIPVETAI